MTELESDVVVEVGDMSFYLHKVSTIECVAVTFRIHQLNCTNRSIARVNVTN